MYSKKSRYQHSLSLSLFLVCQVALLSGARNHRHSLLSQKIYDRMQSLFPRHRADLIAGSVLLSNTYASVGEHEQARDVRNHRLTEFGMKTKVGLTWTEHQGQLLVRVSRLRSRTEIRCSLLFEGISSA